MGAVHFLLKFGRFSADKHKIGFLSSRIFEFIPIKHLKSGGGSKALSSSATADWEGKLYEEVKRVSADLAESDVVAVNEEVDEEGGIAGADVSNGANLLFRLHGKAVSAQRLYLESVYKMGKRMRCLNHESVVASCRLYTPVRLLCSVFTSTVTYMYATTSI